VFVPGLAERMFPQRPREDPLLLDHWRARLSPELDTQEDRARRERTLLRLALGAAEERVVLSYPRLEVLEARPRVPSFYALDVMRAVQGTLPGPQELERAAAEAGEARLAWPAPEDPARALDVVEHDLAVLGGLFDRAGGTKGRARYLLELNTHLARSLRSRWLKWGKKWVPEDGIVRMTEHIAEALAAHRPGSRAYSVTALERFARCPYQFLLHAVHRLERRREAAAIVQLDPLTRGSIIHAMIAETIRTLENEKLLPLRPERLAAATNTLDRLVRRVAAQYEDDLAPAIPRVWEDEVRAIHADLRIWLRHMVEESVTWTPLHAELAFGLPDARPDLREPIEIEGGFKLRGVIDLLERKTDGSALRVTDHKTGLNTTADGCAVGGGEVLQPVLYALAAEKAFGQAVEESRLEFCTSRGGFTERPIKIWDWTRMQAGQALAAIGQALERGALPPAPRKDACSMCDFRPVCGSAEERRWARKPARLTDSLRELRELP
jgi:RecB family exonuclease